METYNIDYYLNTNTWFKADANKTLQKVLCHHFAELTEKYKIQKTIFPLELVKLSENTLSLINKDKAREFCNDMDVFKVINLVKDHKIQLSEYDRDFNYQETYEKLHIEPVYIAKYTISLFVSFLFNQSERYLLLKRFNDLEGGFGTMLNDISGFIYPNLYNNEDIIDSLIKDVKSKPDNYTHINF